VAASVFISGAVEMVLQVIFLLAFQIIQGFVYRQLALIIAFFMAGLAIGAGWISRQYVSPDRINVYWRRFVGVQAGVCLLPICLLFFLLLAHGELRNYLSSAAMGWLFSGLSLITGVLGGIHFALAVTVLAGSGVALEKIGGGFYALDLAGAAFGVLAAALFIIPVYGIMNTLVFLSFLPGISLLTLLRRA
jgi:spermidine synthase